jgi:hypothetical protein
VVGPQIAPPSEKEQNNVKISNLLQTAAVAVALLSLPATALAQVVPSPYFYSGPQASQWNQGNHAKFFNALSTIDLGPNQRAAIDQILRGRTYSEAGWRATRSEIMGVLRPDQQRKIENVMHAEGRGYNADHGAYPNAGAYPNGGAYPPNGGAYPNGGYNRPGYPYPASGQYNGQYNSGGWNSGNAYQPLHGIVAQYSGSNLYLTNGIHIFLHQGTVISPTGNSLPSGTRVLVQGNWNPDHATYNANNITVVGY